MSSSGKQVAKPSGIMGLKTDDEMMEVIPPSQIKYGGLTKKEYEKLPL